MAGRVNLGPFFALLLVLSGACLAQIFQYSDDFESASTLSAWTTLSSAEGWPERFEELSIDAESSGVLRLLPHTGSWYMRKVGGFVFKEIPAGDFTYQTRVHVESRAGGTTLPQSTYSLAGLFVRIPTNWTTWENQGDVDIADCSSPAGYENYVFLSLGRAAGSAWQAEVKTTTDSCSSLEVETANTQDAELQLTRLGDYIVLTRRYLPNGEWAVHRVYPRPDMNGIPALQVGFVAYTDWGFISGMNDEYYNFAEIEAGQTSADHPGAVGTATPDIVGEFHYARFCTVEVPSGLQHITNWATADANDILTFLGEFSPCAIESLPGDGGDGGDGDSSVRLGPWTDFFA